MKHIISQTVRTTPYSCVGTTTSIIKKKGKRIERVVHHNRRTTIVKTLYATSGLNAKNQLKANIKVAETSHDRQLAAMASLKTSTQCFTPVIRRAYLDYSEPPTGTNIRVRKPEQTLYAKGKMIVNGIVMACASVESTVPLTADDMAMVGTSNNALNLLKSRATALYEAARELGVDADEYLCRDENQVIFWLLMHQCSKYWADVKKYNK